MMRPAPLLLLTTQEEQALSESLQGDIAECSDLFLMKPDHPGGHFELNYCGARFLCEIASAAGNYAGLKQIILNTDFAAVRSAVEINVSDAVATAPPLLPIASGLLSAGARLAELLTPSAVVWRPAGLASDTDFFVESIREFANGGAFPALSLVRFTDEDAGMIRTAGLSWFAGQEIEFQLDGLDEKAAIRRMVRVIHDIVVNGPILENIEVTGMEPTERLHISLAADDRLLRIRNSSNPDL